MSKQILGSAIGGVLAFVLIRWLEKRGFFDKVA